MKSKLSLNSKQIVALAFKSKPNQPEVGQMYLFNNATISTPEAARLKY